MSPRKVLAIVTNVEQDELLVPQEHLCGRDARVTVATPGDLEPFLREVDAALAADTR
ncbi:hypothetical protein [Streptomyces sp. NPDC057496]|uniref:hypothetical protein n=1 Tax=Streptomyces sp. NPDC057496 TaxID=3346149 RepID=UPI00367FF99D